MFFITHSKDVLFLTLAVCVFGLSFLLGWGLWYLVSAMRQLKEGAKSLKRQVAEVEVVIKKIKLAFSLPASMLALVMEGVKKLAELGKEMMNDKNTGAKPNKPKSGSAQAKNETKTPDFL